jgi:hypothetical protein
MWEVSMSGTGLFARTGALAALGLIAALAPARAETETACTTAKFCYCVDAAMKPAIEKQVAFIRGLIAQEKGQGKSIGYLSIPLSTVAGSYFGVNLKVAEGAKQRLEARFGAAQVWLLNPGAKEMSLPRGAKGADYMLMWTQVLEGKNGLGEDFDFIVFVGPSDFAQHFGLDGSGDMQKLDAYYDAAAKTDAGLAKVDKKAFRDYYALRASAAFSYGAHDEWNIVRAVNDARRGNKAFGIAMQLPVFFDGRAIPPALFEAPVAPGNAGACPKN